MPLAHVGGLSIQIRSAIYGTTVLLHERFDTERALAALMDPAQRVTLVSLVPTMLSRLLDAGLRAPPTLRRVLLGGGPIAPALLAARTRRTRRRVSVLRDDRGVLADRHRRRPAARHRAARSPRDGEVLVRGRTVAAGALGADGWLHTGDLGALDDAGRLVIAGRKADTIVTGGRERGPGRGRGGPAGASGGRSTPPCSAAATRSGGRRSWPRWCWPTAPASRPRSCARTAPRGWRRSRCPSASSRSARLPRGVTGKLLRRELR